MSLIPDPSELDEDLIRAAELLEHLFENATDIANDLNTDLNAILANSTWPGCETFRNRAINSRLSYSRLLSGLIRSLFDPIFLGYLRVAKKNATQINLTTFRDVVQYFLDTSRVIQRRNPTFDSSVSKTGTGDPSYRRLTVDENGQVIESLFPASTYITAKTVSPNVNRFEEILEFRTESRIDLFSQKIAAESNGDGKKRTYTQKNGDHSSMTDLSFEFAGAATSAGSLSSIGRWKDELASDASINVIAIIDDGYRQSTREKQLKDADDTAPTKQCMRIVSNDIDISQPLPNLSDNTAYDAGIWIRDPNGTATGTFSITIGGATTVNQNVASLVSNTWTLVALPLTADNWSKTLKTDNARYRIHTSSIANTLEIDAAFFHPMLKHNATRWTVLPATTPVGEDYEASFDDTISTDSVVQKLLSLGYPNQDYYLPSAASPSPSELSEAGI